MYDEDILLGGESMFGIRGYEPFFWEYEDDLVLHNMDVLKSIRNQKVINIHWVWDKSDNSWLTDCPVVIQLNNGLMSLCAFQLSSFAIGWNDINVNEEIDWSDDDFPDSLHLEWREYSNEQTEKILGSEITGIEIIKYQFHLHNAKHEERENITDSGLLFGVGIKVDNGILAVTNNLDENKIEVFWDELPEFLIANLYTMRD